MPPWVEDIKKLIADNEIAFMIEYYNFLLLMSNMLEVLRRTSNNYGAVQRVRQLAHHLEEQGLGAESARLPVRAQPAYQGGATTREVGQRFGLAHSSVNKLLKQNNVSLRKRSSSSRAD
jgi:hypothetical protein